MWVEEVDVRRSPGRELMREIRTAFAKDMNERYPDSGIDYGPDALPDGMFRPSGRFLLLYDNDNVAGCVGLRKLPERFGVEGHCAEGKSLFILPEYRGRLGAALLMNALVQSAIECGYEWIYGNTGINQPESQRILKGFGQYHSEEIPLYDTSNPLAAFAYRLHLKPLGSSWH